MVHDSVLYDLAKTAYLVLQLWTKILSANQITTLFDRQYLCKESIDISDFMHEDNHQ